MKVHKYRAWHDENKMMYYSHRPDGSDNPLWSWDVVFRKDWHDWNGCHDTHAQKMQWTGLKDKNGVEIYEGDLFKAFGDKGLIREVVFKDACFGYEEEYMGFIPMKNSNFEWINGVSQKIEVVGNIFEILGGIK